MIRQVQVDALVADRLRCFVRGLAARIAARSPALLADLGEAELHARVQRVVQRSLGAGIHLDRDVTAFVDLSFELGPRLDEELDREWARELLAHAALSGSMKLELLLRGVAHLRAG